MPNPIKEFFGAVREYRAAQRNIKRLKPRIAERKIQGKMLRGESVTLAESHRVLDAFTSDTTKTPNRRKRTPSEY